MALLVPTFGWTGPAVACNADGVPYDGCLPPCPVVSVCHAQDVVPDVNGPQDRPIQPGAQMWTADQSAKCTMGFLFYSSVTKKHYVSTAAHCLPVPCSGGRMLAAEMANAPAFGECKYKSGDERYKDYGLIEVYDAYASSAFMTGSVRLWGGPTDYARQNRGDGISDLQPLDTVLGFGSTGYQRAVPKAGVAGCWSERFQLFRADMSVSVGDSGGPVLLAKNGRAVGLVSGLYPAEQAIVAGPTISYMLGQVAPFVPGLGIVKSPLVQAGEDRAAATYGTLCA